MHPDLDPVGSQPLLLLARGLLRHDWVLEVTVNFSPFVPNWMPQHPASCAPLFTTVSDFIFAPGAIVPATLFDRGRPDEALAERVLETELSGLDLDLLQAISKLVPRVPCSVHVAREFPPSLSFVETLH